MPATAEERLDLGDVVLWMLVGAALLPAHRAAWEEGLPHLVAMVLLDLVVLSSVGIAATSERQWSRLAQEDGVIEWATVAAFLGAALLHLGHARRSWRRTPAPPWLERVARAALGLFCVFVAGEEISWGQRLFAFKPPDAFLERNYQQELNVHNVLMDESGLGFALESKHLVAAIAIAFVVLLPLLVRSRYLAGARAVAPSSILLPAGLVVLAAELSYPVELTGEGAELLLGLVLLSAAALEGRPRASAVALAVTAPVVFGLVLAPLVARVTFGDDAAGSAAARAELALLRRDLEQAGATPKLLHKGSVHKRVFTATRDGYLSLSGKSFLEGQGTVAEPAGAAASARRDRRGYFLDPWNNPYWIAWSREKGRVALYSFGPNRLRDTAVRDADLAAGDDLMEVFVLPPAPPASGD